MNRLAAACLVAVAACGHAREGGGGDAPSPGDATAGTDGAHLDSSLVDGALIDGALIDGALIDGAHADAVAIDAAPADAPAPDAPIGILTGGPCLSGAAGQTAYRVQWTRAGSEAVVVYEVDGLPDHTRDHTSAAGYQIGFTPEFVDPFLAAGGLQLDDSDFVDLEITTAGVTTIASATLSILGRSFDTTTSGSFNWQTFDGTGSSPIDFVSNVAPYVWYSADMTSEIHAGDPMVLIRIYAGPSSNVLVVDRIELCMQAT